MGGFNYDSWLSDEDSINDDKSRYEQEQQDELNKENLSEEY